MTGKDSRRRTNPVRRGSASALTGAGSTSAAEIEISLHAMRFHALIGILDHERSHPQPLEIDLTAWCGGTGIVDYRRLYEAVQKVLGEGPIDYLEEVGDRIANAVLQDGRVIRVRVAVRKPHVTLPGPLAYAQVVVGRVRDIQP
jgi:dihydroneopterin aldolase